MKHVKLTLNGIRFHNPGGSRLNNFKLTPLSPLYYVQKLSWRHTVCDGGNEQLVGKQTSVYRCNES